MHLRVKCKYLANGSDQHFYWILFARAQFHIGVHSQSHVETRLIPLTVLIHSEKQIHALKSTYANDTVVPDTKSSVCRHVKMYVLDNVHSRKQEKGFWLQLLLWC